MSTYALLVEEKFSLRHAHSISHAHSLSHALKSISSCISEGAEILPGDGGRLDSGWGQRSGHSAGFKSF